MEQLKEIFDAHPDLEATLTPIVQGIIEAAVQAANDESQTKIAELTSSIEALEGNNGKLVGEKKEAEKIAKQLQAEFDKLGGEDALRKLASIAQKLGDSTLDAYVEAKTAEAEAGTAAELAKLNQEIAQVDSALARERLTNQITQAANQLLIRPDAMDDVIRFAEANGIRYVDGGLVAGDGDDATVLNATEWLDSLRETKPYYWPPSQGGGAAGSMGAQGRGNFTLTRTEAQDSAKYQAAKEAASKVGQQVFIIDD